MSILMCRNTPVYSIKAKRVLAPNLMPCPPECLTSWRKSRLFQRGMNRMPEEDERQLGANSITVKRRLSLSDSYWFKYDNDKAESFESITPYLNDFFEYGVSASRKSSPSLTVGGSINKIWRRVNNKTFLYKVMRPEWVLAEAAAISLAKKLGLQVNDVTLLSNAEILIHNFTAPGQMLMRFQPWDLQITSPSKVPPDFGYSFEQVGYVYKHLGVQGGFYIANILFDAIVSNYDRLTNLSNWGYFKSSIDGSKSFCPMYDFNLAHPNDGNQYITTVRSQISSEHQNLLRSWKPTVANHGYPTWQRNIEYLLS